MFSGEIVPVFNLSLTFFLAGRADLQGELFILGT
jgi:hypothetical protein